VLVAQARAGDRAAFGRLYDRYARMVHAIAVTRGPWSEADDVVQEVFLRALRRLKTLRSADAFGAWLAAIARRTVADVHRRPRHEGEEAMPDPAIAGTQHEESEARAALEAIRHLPLAYRETVMMRLVEGMTGPEIADRTGLSPASVRVNLHRGMKLLRQRLETGQRGRHA
jgi:RNA polymerase sigma-70 factor (ECF subfamily)